MLMESVQLDILKLEKLFNYFHYYKQFYYHLVRFRMEIRIFEAENEVYHKEKLLGEGAFGKAYLVRKKETGQLLVIKELSIDHMSQQEREQTIKEAQILRNLKHPLIVRFVEVYATKQNKLKIVMQYAECGDLSKAITSRRSEKKFFEQNQILDWFTQICLAMKHVHDRKILHRDIKGQNIFITKTNTLKLGDFGIARVLNKTQDKARTVVGTPYYLSPEIIENKPYSFKSDIWSMGVLLYQLCALSPPFTANSLQFLALKIVKGSYTNLSGNYSKQLKGLVSQCLQLDPNKRPSVGDILKKPFLQDRIRKYLSETYRKDQFSHTVLHNQKIQIANKLVKKQQDKNIEGERNKLKEEAAILKEKMERKKEEERMKDQEKLRRKRQEDQRKAADLQKKKQYEIKMREAEQIRAIQERKAWIEKEKRKQQEIQAQKRRLQQQKRNYISEEQRRVQQIAQMARRRDKEEQMLLAKKDKLMRQKYEMERQKGMQENELKRKQNKDLQAKKIEELNEFARKQWYENQMIKKRAEQRAKQAQMDAYSDTTQESHQSQHQRPKSNIIQRNSSKDNKNNPFEPHKKYSAPTTPSEQEVQNALLNPNFNKKTPQTHHKPPQVKKQNSISKPNSSNVSNKNQKISSPVVEQKKDNKKSAYDEAREKMRRDRQQFLKNKGKANASNIQSNEQPEQAGKWKKRSRSRSVQTPSSQRKRHSEAQLPIKMDQSIMDSNQLRLDIKDCQQFNDYLHELQDCLENVHKNIEKINPLPELPVVEEKIVLREDDNQELDYSITASFDNVLAPKIQISAENADLDYFSSYSKLEDLRICLQDKFGTDNFIKIYRTLQSELQIKGLQNFNIIEVVQKLGGMVNAQAITENLPLLLTLIVMEQKMSSV